MGLVSFFPILPPCISIRAFNSFTFSVIDRYTFCHFIHFFFPFCFVFVLFFTIPFFLMYFFMLGFLVFQLDFCLFILSPFHYCFSLEFFLVHSFGAYSSASPPFFFFFGLSVCFYEWNRISLRLERVVSVYTVCWLVLAGWL